MKPKTKKEIALYRQGYLDALEFSRWERQSKQRLIRLLNKLHILHSNRWKSLVGSSVTVPKGQWHVTTSYQDDHPTVTLVEVANPKEEAV